MFESCESAAATANQLILRISVQLNPHKAVCDRGIAQDHTFGGPYHTIPYHTFGGPYHTFGRCDGHHEMINFEAQRRTTISSASTASARSSAREQPRAIPRCRTAWVWQE